MARGKMRGNANGNGEWLGRSGRARSWGKGKSSAKGERVGEGKGQGKGKGQLQGTRARDKMKDNDE